MRITQVGAPDREECAMQGRHAGTRPHKWAVRMHKIAQRFQTNKDALDHSPFYLVEMTKSVLDTPAAWVLYQTQIQTRRYLGRKMAQNVEKMIFFRVPFIELAGSGTLYFLRRMAPEAYRVVLGGVVEPDDGDGKKTMVEACSSAECSLWRGVFFILVEHQSNMELHQCVNTLLGINDLDWDGVEYTICELKAIAISRALAGV